MSRKCGAITDRLLSSVRVALVLASSVHRGL